MNTWLGREPVESRSECHFLKTPWKPFQALKQACISSPVLDFANYMKDFLLKTDASKEGLGADALPRNKQMGSYHLVAYGSWALTAHEKNYHSTKLEFLVLKWAIMEHFKEYLLYQPFLVKTDNNPLTYIMTTPNLDATGHQWVGALVQNLISSWSTRKGKIMPWPDAAESNYDSSWTQRLCSSHPGWSNPRHLPESRWRRPHCD